MKNRIAELRKMRKISQTELGSSVGVTRQTITSLETGKYAASLPLAMKIARYFQMPVEEIFEITEED